MKNIIIGIIIGGIIFTLGGVVAATTISSKNVIYQNKTVNTALDELYDNAITGKELVAAAITNKGVTTTSNDTYETMATNINSIDTDHTEINQKLSNLESKHNSDIASLSGSISNLNQSLTNLKTFPEDGERLIGTAGRYKVYEVSKAVQLNAGFISFKLCSHNLIQIRSLEAFISSPDNSYIYKANIDNSANVVYNNGTMNLNLTSQTSANNIVIVHCVYIAS